MQLDTTAPLLRPSELIALVRAVHDADPHDEHRWIEWKSELDLSSKRGLAHLAKTIIGLANRQPAAAAQHCGGYGYILVGAEPGAIRGITTVDPEVLTGHIRNYVGDVIRWTPEHITIDGNTVLVIIVAPPRPGDPIHCLRRQAENFIPGAIFVRHTGRTDPHTPADLEMLQARLLERTPSLDLKVAAAPARIEAAPDLLGVVEAWAEEQRPRLLNARYDGPSHGLRPNIGSAFIHQVAKADARTKAAYEEQVAQYLSAAEKALTRRAIWRLYRHRPALLHLDVSNSTDLGYTAVRLTVHISGDVKGYPDDWADDAERELPEMPRPPKPFGTPKLVGDEIAEYARRHGVFDVSSLNSFRPGPTYTVTDSGSVTIEYDEFEVRPHDTVGLDAVPLLVLQEAGSTLTGSWAATAARVRGRLEGAFVLTVEASTLGLSDLDEDPPEDD